MRDTTKDNNKVRTRYHGIVTYATPEQFRPILEQKIKRGTAVFVSYITHDRDVNEDGTPKQTHTHILVATKNANEIGQVRNWFSGLQDEKGEYINTLDKSIPRPADMKDYYTHSDSESIKKGKTRYDESEIVNVVGEWEDLPHHADDEKETITWEMLEDGVKEHKSDIQICKDVKISPMAYSQARQALNAVRRDLAVEFHTEEDYQELRRKYFQEKSEREKWQKHAIENEEYRDMMHNLMVDKTTGELVNKMLELLRQPKYQMVRINPDDLEYLFDNA